MTKTLFNTSTYLGINTNVSFNLSVTNSQLTEKKPSDEPSDVNNPSKIYGEKWIVMQNRMVHAISNLELNERRLVLLLSPIVRKSVDKDPTTKRFLVNANAFAKEFGLKGNDYYDIVRKAALSLQGKSFWTWEFEKNERARYEAKVSWIGKSVYKPQSAIVEIVLMEDVIEMLTIFDKTNPFTKYHKDLLINLNSDGMILLELVASFEGRYHKTESFTTEYIREKFNRVDSYPSISEFKRNVLDKAVSDLKKYTPYVVSYDTEKRHGGRAISHFVFTVHKDKDAIDVPAALQIESTKPKKVYKKGLTDKQIAKLSKNKEQFVLANSHLHDKTMDFYQAFESFKPLLKDKATVNSFNLVDDLLSIPVGDVLVSKNPTKPKKQTATTSTAPNSPFQPTAAQIKTIAANPDFQKDYPKTGHKTGSESHISYLEFRLGSNFTEFTKQPLANYLK